MENTLKSVLVDVLKTFYQAFWFALLFAVVFMFAYKSNDSLKNAVKKWIIWFKTEKRFRRVFFLILYTSVVLFRTLFNRTMYLNPLSNVLGEWSFFQESNGKIVYNSNIPENLIMLAPFVFLLFLTFRDKILKCKVSFPNTLYKSFAISFLFSFSIETLQLFLHIGTWQLSDLVYNTVGGVFGGVIYYFAYIIAKKHKSK